MHRTVRWRASDSQVRASDELDRGWLEAIHSAAERTGQSGGVHRIVRCVTTDVLDREKSQNTSETESRTG